MAQAPAPKLSAIPAVYLDAWRQDQSFDETHDDPDAYEYQRLAAFIEGARRRARYCGADSHGAQAAALLINIEELSALLDGAFSGRDGLSEGEREAVRAVRRSLSGLLSWHIQNGAQALLPIAKALNVDGYRALEVVAS